MIFGICHANIVVMILGKVAPQRNDAGNVAEGSKGIILPEL
jgi:hypothetical protein